MVGGKKNAMNDIIIWVRWGRDEPAFDTANHHRQHVGIVYHAKEAKEPKCETERGGEGGVSYSKKNLTG